MKLVKEAMKIGLKNTSPPEQIVQNAAQRLRDFVKDPGYAIWLAIPTGCQVVGGVMVTKDAGVVKTRRSRMQYLEHGGMVAINFGMPKDLADSFFACAAKEVFP